MSDPRFDVIDNPAANAQRQQVLSLELVQPDPIWPGPEGTKEQWAARYAYDRAVQLKRYAEQEKELLDKRDLLEKFADMIAEHKLRGEQIEKFARDNDIPGVCGWSGIENYIDNDIVGDAIQWAASNHNC